MSSAASSAALARRPAARRLRPGAHAGVLADLVRSDPAALRAHVSARRAALSHAARAFRARRRRRRDRDVTDTQTGRASAIAAHYLVGCDGAASPTRRQLGIELDGTGTIGNPINLFFVAPDLLARCGRKPATFYLCVDKGGCWANLRIINPATGLWRLMIDNTDGNVSEDGIDREAIWPARSAAPTRCSGSIPASGGGAARSRKAMARPRAAGWRQRPPALADRRDGHEHRSRRRRRSRRGSSTPCWRAGAARPDRILRCRAPTGRRPRCADGDRALQEQRGLPRRRRSRSEPGQRARRAARR